MKVTFRIPIPRIVSAVFCNEVLMGNICTCSKGFYFVPEPGYDHKAKREYWTYENIAHKAIEKQLIAEYNGTIREREIQAQHGEG
jgi:hypothetical protein